MVCLGLKPRPAVWWAHTNELNCGGNATRLSTFPQFSTPHWELDFPKINRNRDSRLVHLYQGLYLFEPIILIVLYTTHLAIFKGSGKNL